MTSPVVTPPNHPLRFQLANELHARPAPHLRAPCHAVFLATKLPRDAANRSREADRAHLIALLDRFGAQHPPEGAAHYYGRLGRHMLRWENYTEFTTYTIFAEGVAERPFDSAAYDVFPPDWLAALPGAALTSAFIRVEEMPGDGVPVERIEEWFSADNLAMSLVNDASAAIATDLMPDASGHMRFAVFARPGISERRLGRIVQRLLEVEAYKAMALLALPRAREAAARSAGLDVELAAQVEAMNAGTQKSEETLRALLSVGARIEQLVAATAYRFSATEAYSEIVRDRVALLREERIEGRQTLKEFMSRRFEPAMRTVRSAGKRLDALSERARRVGDLLRTQVDVERNAQNQAILQSMDRRAELQLRLQHAVEGFSVIALSYYAVNLVGYLIYPLQKPWLHWDKPTLTAALVLPVMLCVWGMVAAFRRRIGGHPH